MNKPNLATLIGEARVALDRHSPEILLGVGIAGMITTTVLAVRATPKALIHIEAKKAEERKEKLTVGETIKVTWKDYIPAVVTGVSSIACLIGSNTVQARRTAAIATAYKISETAFTEFREKVRETIGEKKEKVLHEEIAAEKATHQTASTSQVYCTGDGETLFLDPISMRLFKSDINKVKRAQNEINERMLKSAFYGYASLNDFYDEIGLEPTSQGDDLGWNLDELMDVSFGAGLTKDDKPCIVLNYSVAPKYNYAL